MKRSSLLFAAALSVELFALSSPVAWADNSGAVYDSHGKVIGSYEEDPDGLGGTFNDLHGNFAGEERRTGAHSATFEDENGVIVSSERNGKFEDRNGRFIGSFNSNKDGSGKFKDKNGKFLGKMDANGHVYNHSGSYIGTVPKGNEEAARVILQDGHIDDHL